MKYGVVTSIDDKAYYIETEADVIGLSERLEKPKVTLIALKDKVFEDLKSGDAVSFIQGKIYLGGKIIPMADLVKKEASIKRNLA